MWRVVNFAEEGTVEAVPLSWIIDDSHCYWPPARNNTKLKMLIQKCEGPSENWEVFKIRIIGEAYGDLTKARMKALKAETTSDINSDIDDVRKNRIRKKNRFLESSSSSEHEYESEEVGKTCAKLPILNMTKTTVEVHAVEKVPDEHQIQKTNYDISGKNDNTPNKKDDRRTKNDNAIVHSDQNFQRHVIRQLNLISLKMDQLSQDIANIQQVQNIQEAKEQEMEESIFTQFQLPLHTVKELMELDVFLQDAADTRNKMIKELAIVGGLNYKIMVKRIMTKIIANELAVQYSWIGFKQKQNFSILQIAGIIIEAVQKVHKSSRCTNADVENAVKQWLVKAPERLKIASKK